MSLVSALNALIDESLEKEVIGGTSIKRVVDSVMLDVAFSPVVKHNVGDTYEHDIPHVCEVVETQGGKSYIVRDGDSAESVSADSLKVMRARFLLLRDYYHKRLLKENLTHTQRSEVISRFFGGSVYIPPKGALRDAMLR